MFSGTTAVSVLMLEDQLWIANAGDSRAVLAVSSDGGKLKAVDLSIDQNPNSPAEQVIKQALLSAEAQNSKSHCCGAKPTCGANI